MISEENLFLLGKKVEKKKKKRAHRHAFRLHAGCFLTNPVRLSGLLWSPLSVICVKCNSISYALRVVSGTGC